MINRHHIWVEATLPLRTGGRLWAEVDCEIAVGINYDRDGLELIAIREDKDDRAPVESFNLNTWSPANLGDEALAAALWLAAERYLEDDAIKTEALQSLGVSLPHYDEARELGHMQRERL